MFINKKKIKHLELIPIILISFILFKIVNEPGFLFGGLRYVISIFSYLIWAFVIAFLLNPMMVYLERKFKINRIFSILIIYLLFVALIAFVIIVITPILVENIGMFLKNLDSYVTSTQSWITEIIDDLKLDDKYDVYTYLENNINDILQMVKGFLNISLNFVFKKIIDLTSTMLKLIFGILISIYLLSDKEKLIIKIKKLLFAVLSSNTAKMSINIGRKLNNAFSKYIIGKLIDSAIIGVICFLGLFTFKVPFALLISIIVGVTNLIPYIGGIVGLIPAVIIILIISPIKALFVFLFLLVLQQLDSWILSPKIIGNQTGLTPLLIIVALMVGGATFGIMGMFIAIPVTAVIKEFVGEYVENRLKAKGIDDSTIKS
ncbi:MAG: AI-2E family transporter [Clostridia bacterium]|nr:AI-2E family transporter [Clostridia bacterium]